MTRSPRTAVPAAEMAALVADGRATRLLPELDVVPTRFDGRWWYIPEASPADDYVPAPAGLAAHYDEWRAEMNSLDTLAETYQAQTRAGDRRAP